MLHFGERDTELHRIKREVQLQQEDSGEPEAEQQFRGSLEIPRNQGARFLELRAATTLARFLAERGDPEQARSLLARSTTGSPNAFEPPDLNDAKAPLERLA